MGWGGRGINLQMKRLMGWVDDEAYGFMQITQINQLYQLMMLFSTRCQIRPYPYLRGLFNSALSY